MCCLRAGSKSYMLLCVRCKEWEWQQNTTHHSDNVIITHLDSSPLSLPLLGQSAVGIVTASAECLEYKFENFTKLNTNINSNSSEINLWIYLNVLKIKLIQHNLLILAAFKRISVKQNVVLGLNQKWYWSSTREVASLLGLKKVWQKQKDGIELVICDQGVTTNYTIGMESPLLELL